LHSLPRILTLAALLALPALSHAQLSPYVFAGAGEAQNGSTDTAARVGVGIEVGIIPIFTPSVEASYFYSAGAKGSVLNGKVDLPLPVPGLTPFVKAGFGRVGKDSGSQADTGMVGVGLEVEMLDWGIRLEGDYYRPDNQETINVWTLGMRYTF
jgi:hypothetical protein